MCGRYNLYDQINSDQVWDCETRAVPDHHTVAVWRELMARFGPSAESILCHPSKWKMNGGRNETQRGGTRGTGGDRPRTLPPPLLPPPPIRHSWGKVRRWDRGAKRGKGRRYTGNPDRKKKGCQQPFVWPADLLKNTKELSHWHLIQGGRSDRNKGQDMWGQVYKPTSWCQGRMYPWQGIH